MYEYDSENLCIFVEANPFHYELIVAGDTSVYVVKHCIVGFVTKRNYVIRLDTAIQ